MIYFDNAATTLQKPKAVSEAITAALETFGNPGRSFHAPAMTAAKAVYAARAAVAGLVGLDDPLQVAFTSSATEALNLVADAILEDGDSVVVTAAEHNSVLRPLYRKNCQLSVLDCDDNGVMRYETLPELLTDDVKAVFACHGSNVTGNVIDAYRFYDACRNRGIPLVLDVAQSFGSVPVRHDMADIICFTGHKGLFGLQGTGGIILSGNIKRPMSIKKTGGTGWDSFSKLQPNRMPDIFEAGTINSHGLSGLLAGASFVARRGIGDIHEKEMALTRMFTEGVKGLPGVCIYGDFSAFGENGPTRLPIVSLNIKGLDSAVVAEALWERRHIATRHGVHCAPLLHKRLGTAEQGMVRFSFSCFNTEDEILAGIEAIRAYTAECGNGDA